MSKQANPAVIGGFVLGALVLLVGALIALGSGALLRERIALVTFFPGSVQGLDIGAQVQFQGVPIGQVTAINLDYLPDDKRFRIPVFYDIWPRNVDVIGGFSHARTGEVIRQLVSQKGLRARLESVSLVTGQYVVSLNLNPRLPAQPRLPDHKDAIQIPAIEATRDRVEDLISTMPLNDLVEQATGTLQGIHDLFASGKVDRTFTRLDQTLLESQRLLQTLNQEINPLIDNLQQLLTDYSELASATRAHIDSLAPAMRQAADNTAAMTEKLQQDLAPLTASAQTAVAQANKTLIALNSLVAADSPTRYQLDQVLRETTAAARSIRHLADYLERHPEALLSGKQGGRAR